MHPRQAGTCRAHRYDHARWEYGQFGASAGRLQCGRHVPKPMNHPFGPYISVFVEVYLDNILIYSDTLEDHVQHVKTIVDILEPGKLYLDASLVQQISR